MSVQSRLTVHGLVLALTTVFIGLIAVLAFRPSVGQTAPAEGTTSIRHDEKKAREIAEPSYGTAEERLNAKPLDWNSTIGTPKPRALTAQERKTLANAKRGASSGGAPDPKAEAEARKLHPDDWK